MIKNILSKFLSTSFPETTKTTQKTVQSNKIYLFEPNQQELEKIINSPMKLGKAPGYVYFVQEYMNGTFKIGKTKNVEKRMNLFGVKLPFENQLVFLINSADHHQTEVAFHKHFSSKRLEGEWFALNKEDISWIKAGHYTPEINQTIIPPLEPQKKKADSDNKNDNNPLTSKQLEFAKTLIKKLEDEYELVADYNSLTEADLKRLSVYFRFKNKGALNNLVASGVLKRK